MGQLTVTIPDQDNSGCFVVVMCFTQVHHITFSASLNYANSVTKFAYDNCFCFFLVLSLNRSGL
jgi:hypothetical protein